MQTIEKIALGLITLGIAFVIIDFFFARLLKKMYPDPNCWFEALTDRSLTNSERLGLERRKRLYEAGVSHYFRKHGARLCLIGFLILIGCFASH
jgi:hypothetical protein